MATGAPSWLKNYYGSEFDRLNPTVIAEGEVYAVVRLQREAGRGFHGTGYVLIKKSGRHNSSNAESLWEGTASANVLETMKKRLTEKEAEH